MLLDASKTDLDNGILILTPSILTNPILHLKTLMGLARTTGPTQSTAIDRHDFNEGDIKVRVANINLSNGNICQPGKRRGLTRMF